MSKVKGVTKISSKHIFLYIPEKLFQNQVGHQIEDTKSPKSEKFYSETHTSL